MSSIEGVYDGYGQSRKSFLEQFADWRRNLLGYGPFRFSEPILWLLLASLLRVLASLFPPLIFLAQIPILFAFISATARVIDLMQGRTQLTRMNFEQTWALSKVILKMLGIGFLFCVLAHMIVSRNDGSIQFVHLYLTALDGVAFDVFKTLSKIISPAAALFIFIVVVNSGTGKSTNFFGVYQELIDRSRYYIPAFFLVLGGIFLLSEVQGLVRPFVYEYVRMQGTGNAVSKWVFFTFVVGFAYLRLTIVVGIYAYWLRKLYQSVV